MLLNDTTKRKVLICDDSPLHRMSLQKMLANNFECYTSKNADEALVALKLRDIDVLLLDITMRSEEEGLEYLPRFRGENPSLAIVISSFHTQLDFVRRALTQGADDYLNKEATQDELLISLERVLRLRDLKKKNLQKDFEIRNTASKKQILGQSPAMQDLLNKIEKLKRSDVNVIVQGESGTGKELVARALRRTCENGELEPFVVADARTLQNKWVESLLFGHDQGAFEGADTPHVGLIEKADGGVLYFDEITNVPLEIQKKLVRVVQEKEVVRMASLRPLKLNFRVISVTHQNLEMQATQGLFNMDLLHRLGVITLHVPPLRERKEDIPQLVEYFLENTSPGIPYQITSDTMECLMKYDWPGNVRELGNVVSYLRTMSEGPIIRIEDLPQKLSLGRKSKSSLPVQRVQSLATSLFSDRYQESIKNFEREFLIDAYIKSEANIAAMARRIGLDRSYLYSKLRSLDLFPISKLKEKAGL